MVTLYYTLVSKILTLGVKPKKWKFSWSIELHMCRVITGCDHLLEKMYGSPFFDSQVILLLPSLMVVVSILLVVLPLWQDPVPQLLGFAGVLAGLPVYIIFVMEKPWRLKPRIFDRISDWLSNVTGKMFNTELSDAF